MDTASLESLCELISSGGTPSRRKLEYFAAEGGHRWVKSQELIDRSIYDTDEKISDLGLRKSSAKYYDQDTVLIAMYGATVGQLGILRVPATVNQAICALRVDETKADYRYVFYALMATRHDLVVQAAGAAQQNLNQGLIKGFEIPILPLEQQRLVGGLLGLYDDLIENNRRRIVILEETARLIYREWFVHFRFPRHEDVELVDSEHAPIPATWTPGCFGDVVELSRDAADPDAIPGDAVLVGLEHLPRRSITLHEWDAADEVGSRKSLFRAGDILFGKIRPYFHKVVSAPVDGYCSTDAIVFRPRPSYDTIALATASSDPFVAHAVQTSNGTKMPRANTDVLLRYPVALPPEDVRKSFERTVSPMVELCKVLSAKVRVLAKSRDLVLPRLISGELDISGLDLGLESVA